MALVVTVLLCTLILGAWMTYLAKLQRETLMPLVRAAPPMPETRVFAQSKPVDAGAPAHGPPCAHCGEPVPPDTLKAYTGEFLHWHCKVAHFSGGAA